MALAMPALVAAVLAGIRGHSIVVPVAVMVALVQVGMLRPAIAQGAERVVVSVARTVGRVLERVLSAVVYGIVFVPAWLVAVLVGLDPVERRSGWVQPVHGSATATADRVRRARRPSTQIARVHQPGVRLRVGALALIVMSLVAWQVQANPPPARSKEEPAVFAREFAANYSDLPAYRGVAFADALQKEEAPVPDVTAFDGRYVNIRDGMRVTATAPACSCQTSDVWITGGSAVWGIGQRDQRTIASGLVRAASERGVRLRVDNMGHRGWVLQQQVDLVASRLRTDPAPELIIFYAGFNETGVAMADEMLRGGDPMDRALVSGGQQDLDVAKRMGDLAEINRRVDEYLKSGIGPKVGEATAREFLRQQARVARIAERHHTKAIFFFQPDALASRHQLEPYEAISHMPTKLMAVSPFSVALSTAASMLGDRVVNLRPVFDEEDDQVFLGLVHTNEEGAQIVADAMVPTVLQQLR